MTESIYLEARLFLAAFLLGVILIFVYDVLRIIRRIIIHSLLIIAIEDFLFWCGTGLACFGLMFYMYQGRLRAFYFIGLFLGMALYYFNLSPVVVETVAKALKKVIQILRNIIVFFVTPFIKKYKKWNIKKKEQQKVKKSLKQEKENSKKKLKEEKREKQKQERKEKDGKSKWSLKNHEKKGKMKDNQKNSE